MKGQLKPQQNQQPDSLPESISQHFYEAARWGERPQTALAAKPGQADDATAFEQYFEVIGFIYQEQVQYAREQERLQWCNQQLSEAQRYRDTFDLRGMASLPSVNVSVRPGAVEGPIQHLLGELARLQSLLFEVSQSLSTAEAQIRQEDQRNQRLGIGIAIYAIVAVIVAASRNGDIVSGLLWPVYAGGIVLVGAIVVVALYIWIASS